MFKRIIYVLTDFSLLFFISSILLIINEIGATPEQLNKEVPFMGMIVVFAIVVIFISFFFNIFRDLFYSLKENDSRSEKTVFFFFIPNLFSFFYLLIFQKYPIPLNFFVTVIPLFLVLDFLFLLFTFSVLVFIFLDYFSQDKIELVHFKISIIYMALFGPIFVCFLYLFYFLFSPNKFPFIFQFIPLLIAGVNAIVIVLIQRRPDSILANFVGVPPTIERKNLRDFTEIDRLNFINDHISTPIILATSIIDILIFLFLIPLVFIIIISI